MLLSAPPEKIVPLTLRIWKIMIDVQISTKVLKQSLSWTARIQIVWIAYLPKSCELDSSINSLIFIKVLQHFFSI